MKSSGLFIGTSGWSYKHWADVFYPENTRPASYLEYYITRFNCVELNTSFYHLPKKTTIAAWMRRTPESFVFCPKLSRFITHQLRLRNTEEALKRFFDLFDEMIDRLGPVLIQLPPGLPFDKTVAENFLNLLKERYDRYRFAVEVRHKSWIGDDFMNLLEKYNTAFAIADSGKRFPYHEAVTTDFVYLRFHGHEQLYASEYSEAELKFYAEKIKDWLKGKKKVWAFFNNDNKAFAVKNALQLRNIMELF